MTTERRKFSRINGNSEFCTLTINKTPHEVRLLDQSINGFRVESIELLVFTNTVPITVQLDGSKTRVVCRNIERLNQNEFALGLQRLEDSSSLLDQLIPEIFINPYVQLDSLNVLCSPFESLGSKLVVQLPGKRNFDVQRNEIATRTRAERETELLSSTKNLKALALFYQAASGVEVRPQVRSILEFEFGVAPPKGKSLTKVLSAAH